jgi:hypothetical protein
VLNFTNDWHCPAGKCMLTWQCLTPALSWPA